MKPTTQKPHDLFDTILLLIMKSKFYLGNFLLRVSLEFYLFTKLIFEKTSF